MAEKRNDKLVFKLMLSSNWRMESFCSYVIQQEIMFLVLMVRDVGRIQKAVGAYVFRGTLINKNWQLLKLRRSTLPNNL